MNSNLTHSLIHKNYALEDIASAATKDDVRKLIEDGIIKRKPVRGISRARIKRRKLQRKKGNLREVFCLTRVFLRSLGFVIDNSHLGGSRLRRLLWKWVGTDGVSA